MWYANNVTRGITLVTQTLAAQLKAATHIEHERVETLLPIFQDDFQISQYRASLKIKLRSELNSETNKL